MAEIIILKEKDEINRKLQTIFDEIDVFIRDNDDVYFDQSSEYYESLINYFYNVYDKVRKNKWNNGYNIKFLENFEKITIDENIYNKYTNQMEYIRLYDLLREELFQLNDKYIKILIYIGFELDEISIEKYKIVIKLLSNKLIKKNIDEEESLNKKLNLILDYIDCIDNGLNPIELAVSIKNEKTEREKEGFDDLSSGIMTIDRIYNFYINQAYSCKSLFETFPSDEIFDNIKKIVLIKNYSNIIQIKFIVLVQKFQEVEQSLDGRFKFISDLVDIFLYYKEKIENIDIDNLSNILFYKRINDLTTEETIENLLLDEKRL